MRRDHRPYWMRSAETGFEAWWTRHFLAPQFEGLGDGAMVRRPWNVDVFGPGIAAGRHLHLHAEAAARPRFSTWARPDRPPPHIRIGDHVLIMPGVMLNAALSIAVGDDCMLASQVMISDSDWHAHYDRTQEPETNAPVVLERNVWIGLRAIVCKGVTIGENSIVGAGAVVTRDVPANAIAAGNPARVVAELDPAHEMRTRGAMFADSAALSAWTSASARAAAQGNTSWGFLRSQLFPSRED
jgi:acetyltransferase-like isoleucine patch superfamily enzyme